MSTVATVVAVDVGMLPVTPTDALQQIADARVDLARFDYVAASRRTNDGLAREDINQVQRERLFLLRADAFHGLCDYERALRDANAADQIAEGQSPQAHFIRGRELFALCRLQEAKDAFDMAEVLMLTATPLRYTSLDGKPASAETVWANIGVAPRDVPPNTSPPEVAASGRTVTYDWVQDLARWRAVRDECAAALNVSQTRLVPRAVLTVTQNLMERRLIQKSSRYVVILIRNDTTEPLIFDFHKFKDGQFLEGCLLPSTIPPLSTAIAGAHATGWVSGVRGTVAFRLQSHAVLFSFDCPLTSGFSSKACIVPRTQIQQSGSLSPTAKPVPVAKIGNTTFRATAAPPGYVQAFSVTMLNSVQVSLADVAAIFDFLPPQALRKATAVSRQWRQLCMNVPPSRFYSLAKPFPDYRLDSDFDESCWTIRDASSVKWSVKSEPTFNDERLISFIDCTDQRIFYLQCDIFARATNATLYYGSKKTPVISFEESFFRSTRKTTMKMGSRTVATLVSEGNVVELHAESSRVGVLLSLERVSDTLYSIRSAKDKSEVAKVVINSRTARKSTNVAELIMHCRADALLSCAIAFYALFRIA